MRRLQTAAEKMQINELFSSLSFSISYTVSQRKTISSVECDTIGRVYKVPFLKNYICETALLRGIFWRFSKKHHFVNSPTIRIDFSCDFRLSKYCLHIPFIHPYPNCSYQLAEDKQIVVLYNGSIKRQILTYTRGIFFYRKSKKSHIWNRIVTLRF